MKKDRDITENLSAVILAGGESRRFGSDKAMARFDGETLLGRAARVVAAVSDDVLISLADDKPLPGGFDGTVVYDRISDGGPLAGIHAALAATEREWLLVVACDMPRFTESALRTLLAARSPRADAVVAVDSRGRRHPLLACYRRTVQQVIERRLKTRRLSVLDLLAELDSVETIPLPDNALTNVNYREELLHELGHTEAR